MGRAGQTSGPSRWALPFKRVADQRAALALAAAVHRAVGLRRLLDNLGRQAHRFVEAVDHRPQYGRRQIEGQASSAARDRRHGVGTAAPGRRIRREEHDSALS